MNNLTLLIKPASYRCNLSCSYCFYKRAGELYPDNSSMTDEVLEIMIRKAFKTGASVINFIWQGGEPGLMGLDFYRKAVELQQSLASPGQKIENALQTNGTLLTDEWYAFLSQQKNWIVGISIDGPEKIHDSYRKYPDGRGSFQKVMEGLELLKKYRVPFNILTLLTDNNIRQPEKLWEFYKKNRFTHLQFINCFEIDYEQNTPTDYSIKSRDLADFYCRLFDLWIKDSASKVSIRQFEDILIYFFYKRHVSCSYMKQCDTYFVVEHNGDIYPCDFFVYPEWKIGSLLSDDFSTLSSSPLRKKFSEMKSRVSPVCLECELFDFCNGDCTKFRLSTDGNYSNVSAYCESLKALVRHMEPRFPELARLASGEQTGSLSRNDLCICGSGLKYKKCCATDPG